MTIQTVDMQKLQAQLKLTLKDLYPKCLGADERLERLQANQKRQFSAIFQEGSEFNAKANRFLTCLIELSDEVQSLPMMASDNQPTKVRVIAQKMKLMHQTFNRFHSIED